MSRCHLGGQWVEQRVQHPQGPGDTRAWVFDELLSLVSDDAARSGAGVLGCQADAGTLLWRQKALEGTKQGSVPEAAWIGGVSCLSQCHRISEHSQRPVSENFNVFIPRQLAWHIFRWCYFCSFQKVEMEKKKKQQIDIIFPRSYFNTETTGEPTHHFKMLLKSALPHICLCTCESVAYTWITFGFKNLLVQISLFPGDITVAQKGAVTLPRLHRMSGAELEFRHIYGKMTSKMGAGNQETPMGQVEITLY